MKIRQDTRLLAVLLVFLAFLVTWLVMAGQASQRNYRASRLEDYPLPKPTLPEAAEPQRRPIAVSKWLRNILEDAGIPVVKEAADDTGEADRGCILHGKLVWENRPWLPFKGVEVRLTDAWLDTIVPTEKREARDPLLLPPKATTDEWGKFVLRDVPTRETLFLLVRDDNHTLMVKKLRHLPLPGQLLNLYEVEVPEQGTIRGRVVDEDGKPPSKMTVRAVSDLLNRGPLHDTGLAAQRIERAGFFGARGQSGPNPVPKWVIQRDRLLPFPSTTSQRDGRFVLHGVRTGRVTLIVRGKNALTVERGVHVEAGEVTDIGTLVAHAGMETEIVISDSQENRVIGAEVSIQVGGWPMTMSPLRTNMSGTAVCNCLPEGPLTVFVRTQGSQIWEVADRTDSWTLGGRQFFYRLAKRLNGFIDVVDPAGRPVADAVAALSYLDSAFTDEWIELPDHVKASESEPGSFELQNLPDGQALRLVVAAPDHAPAVLGFRVGRGDLFRPGGLQVTLRPIFPIRFVVRGVNDHPVANARVSVMFQRPPKPALPGTDDHLLTRGGGVLGHTDENGVLDTPAFWRSWAWFAAWHPDYGLTPTQLTYPRPGMVVPIKLRPTGRVTGELTFSGEQPAARWIIRAQPAAYFSTTDEKNPFFKTYRTVTAPDGSFYFNDLLEGPCSLTLHRLAADPDRTLAFSWPDGGSSQVDVLAAMTVAHKWNVPRDRLSRLHITGTAQMDGKPLAHAVVRLHAFPDASNLEAALKAIRSAWSKTNEEVNRSHGHGAAALRRRAERLEVVYREIWRMGRAPPPDRFPEGVLVLSEHPVTMVRADAEGRFDIALRRPGIFELRLVDPDGRQELARARTTLTSGRDRNGVLKRRRRKPKDGAGTNTEIADYPVPREKQEIHFNVQTGSLRLAVTTHETLRVRQRIVRLTQEPDGAVFRVRTDLQGDVFVPNIPAGRYRLTVEGHGVDGAGVRNPIVEITPGTLNIHHAYTDPYVRLTEPVKQRSK
jgi:hypothetical protein